MSLHVAAQYLAQQGRDGDTHLLHVTGPELHGIAALGEHVGRPLTTNPHTGLPEASGLSDWLPAVLGLGANFLIPGISPLMMGLIAGGSSALMTGNLGKGIMTGLLAGGGSSLMGSLAGAGESQLAGQAAQQAVAGPASTVDLAATDLAGTGGTAGMGGSQYGAMAADPYVSALQAQAPTAAELASTPGTNAQLPMQQTMGTDPSYWEKLKAGASRVMNDPMKFLKDNKSGVGMAGLGALGLAAAQSQSGLQSSFLKAQQDAAAQREALKAQYASQVQGPWVTPTTVPQRDPFSSPNFIGGRPGGYAEGGPVNSYTPPKPGYQYQYQPDAPLGNSFNSNPVQTNSTSGYDNLFTPQQPVVNQVPGYSTTPTAATPVAVPTQSNPAIPGGFSDVSGWLSAMQSPPSNGWTDATGTLEAAPPIPKAIGPTEFPGGFTNMNDWLTAMQSPPSYAMGGGIKSIPMPGYSKTAAHRRSVSAAIRKMYQSKNEAIADMRNPDSPLRDMGITKADDPMLNAAFAGQDIVHAAGGKYLQGPGDGLSDSIPARIDGVQEARLADGEVVLPADFVSSVGNGSSNAGAKKIMAHVAHVRRKKYGTTKQPGPLKGPVMPGMK